MQRSEITAVLGPTNTGKTRYAVERMAAHRSGVIGFPLRLLARENYDRLVGMKGAEAVALVTGEEKIVPPGARYFSCTVEAMPMDRDFDFVGVDEIQMCGEPDRGHVFTDRLLRARGRVETMFMGAETIRPVLSALLPGVQFKAMERFSKLSYSGYKKLARMPPRSAIVAFSIEDVYAIAELMRRQRGGTAVVLGALSPRTRNRQVEMYQNGEVDFLVATDAIGMGLNMDIHHAALAATRKYDGDRPRPLSAAEIAQIAGRAGRHTRDGTFGITGRVRDLDPEIVAAVENHAFEKLKAIYWRNADLDFSRPAALLNTLEKGSGNPLLARGRLADDFLTLSHLARREDVLARAATPDDVGLLWEVCQIPDFRKTLSDTHYELAASVYVALMDRGNLDTSDAEKQLARLDDTEGDIDSLMTRIAHIRTWTYITHKAEWLENAGALAERARAIEDRLSDALHEGLMRRFVDRRSAVLMRAMEAQGVLLAGVKAGGEVVVEGYPVGHLEGFRFVPDVKAEGADHKAVMAAARNALRPEIKRRTGMTVNAQAKQFRLTDEGDILFQSDPTNPLPGQKVARIAKGREMLSPDVDVQQSDFLEGQDRAAIAEKLQEWLKGHIGTVLEPLTPLRDETGLEGAARGIAFQLHEAMGILPRADLESLISGLDEAGRAALRQRKVRLGPVLVFLPALGKPAAVRLRALLWSLWRGLDLPAKVPHDGATSVPVPDPQSADPAYYRAIGYPLYASRAIRVDMLDRVISAVYDGAKDGKFQAKHEMAEWLGCGIPDLYAVLEAMGHRKVFDPADQPAPEVVEEKKEEEKPAEPKPQIKPELATFQLRRGKAGGGDRKPHHKKEEHTTPPQQREKREKRPRDKERKKESRPERQERIISARPKGKPEDSPFAVLKGMKIGSKE